MAKLVKEETGQDHPATKSKPALRGDCIKYHDAFCLLGASRLWTQVGPEPFQISEITSLLNLLGIEDRPTRMKYVRLIQKMDRVELKFHAEQMKKLSKAK